jgi:hypothetical protein
MGRGAQAGCKASATFSHASPLPLPHTLPHPSTQRSTARRCRWWCPAPTWPTTAASPTRGTASTAPRGCSSSSRCGWGGRAGRARVPARGVPGGAPRFRSPAASALGAHCAAASRRPLLTAPPIPPPSPPGHRRGRGGHHQLPRHTAHQGQRAHAEGPRLRAAGQRQRPRGVRGRWAARGVWSGALCGQGGGPDLLWKPSWGVAHPNTPLPPCKRTEPGARGLDARALSAAARRLGTAASGDAAAGGRLTAAARSLAPFCRSSSGGGSGSGSGSGSDAAAAEHARAARALLEQCAAMWRA